MQPYSIAYRHSLSHVCFLLLEIQILLLLPCLLEIEALMSCLLVFGFKHTEDLLWYSGTGIDRPQSRQPSSNQS